jgi:glucose-6-phosphate isomerase
MPVDNNTNSNNSALQRYRPTLLKHLRRLANFRIADALEQEEQQRFHIHAAGLNLDFSKNLIDQPTLDTLINIAREAGTKDGINALYCGQEVNNTEKRPALHTLLRASREQTCKENRAFFSDAEQVKTRLTRFVNDVQRKFRVGATLEAFTDIVNIGIGGSDLGPAMAYQALSDYRHKGIACHFVSNVDPQQIESTLATLNPATTLFVVSSKSFTTQETLANAEQARQWLLSRLNADKERIIARHFVGVTAKPEKAKAFGLVNDNIFPIWDWVGGRYSMWSAISLSLALSIGMRNFEQLLAGAQAMDQHFVSSPLDNNMPVILALLSVWYTDFWQCQSHAVIPYSQVLNRFPAYLQQLAMESNGKSVKKDGSAVDYATCPIIWGEAGTNSQHSFFQLLHQGPHVVPVDFILPLTTKADTEQHKLLIANCLAQSRALMLGKTADEVSNELRHQQPELSETEIAFLSKHKTMPGNRPSNLIYMDTLSPSTLGALVALYEHKTYVESILWDINAFDQWGVELGKVMCEEILANINHTSDIELDSSSEAMIKAYQDANDR